MDTETEISAALCALVAREGLYVFYVNKVTCHKAKTTHNQSLPSLTDSSETLLVYHRTGGMQQSECCYNILNIVRLLPLYFIQ